MRNITLKQERKMKKRILIVTNHSYMFWQFRKELVEALQKEHEVSTIAAISVVTLPSTIADVALS